MVGIIEAYQCEECNKPFYIKDEAEICEKTHFKGSELEVGDFFYKKGDGQFPSQILIGCESYSGVLGLYQLQGEGSNEDYSYLYPEEYQE